MRTPDIEGNLRRYLDGAGGSDGREPDARYASFDYCFNYFQSFRESGDIAALASPEHRQISCLQLGFYLASWGMLRGSGDLLQRSARHLVPVVEAIAQVEASLWEIDAHCYRDDSIERILELGNHIRDALRVRGSSVSDILVTKVILGVFGSVPALDTNFRRGFRAMTLCRGVLRRIREFYEANDKVIDEYRVPTLAFLTGEPTERLYTRAKVIDMVFFIQGMR